MAYSFSDLLSFKKCPVAFQKGGDKHDFERVPLCREAAESMFDLSNPDNYIFSPTAESGIYTASADLLLRHGDKWELVYNTCALQLREVHIWETSYITYLFTHNGYPISKITALVINGDYVRGEQISWNSLYMQYTITTPVLSRTKSVVKLMQRMANTADMEIEPFLQEHCLKPRECPYWSECTDDLPHPNIFSIVGMNTGRKFKLFDDGIVSYEDCLEIPKLGDPQLQQIKAELEQRDPSINVSAIRSFTKQLQYPLYFLDFESYQSPVPLYSGMKPFEQIPFLYSLHIVADKDAAPQHKECFVDPGCDPRPIMAKQLAEDIPANAVVVVYSNGLEKHMLKLFAEYDRSLSAHMTSISRNMVDLLNVFRPRHYYDRRMQGSCSLKKTALAFTEQDEYSMLSDVHTGDDAMYEYAHITDETLDEMKEKLCKYCAVDTMSMVRIVDKLVRI